MFHRCATILVVAASLVLAFDARAQSSQQPDVGSSTPVEGAPATVPESARPAEPAARGSAQASALTDEQIAIFARMVEATGPEVATRLESDAAMRGVALGALEARESRRSSGKAMAIVGFTILGIGDIVGAVIIVTAPGYPRVESGQTGRILLGMGVGIAAAGVGLALAIPGLVKMGRPGSVELQAIADYRRQGPAVLDTLLDSLPNPSSPPPSANRSLVPSPVVTLPLVSLAF